MPFQEIHNMKIKKLILQNYKKFLSPTPFSFCDEDGEVNDITLIVGNNGSGKTSLLQAIACVVGSSVKPFSRPNKMDWAGFEYRHLQNGNMPLKIEASLSFSTEEINAIHTAAQKLIEMEDRTAKLPNKQGEIVLKLDYANGKVLSDSNYWLTKGYQSALKLKKQVNIDLFDKIGSIYWYTEQRTSFSLHNPDQKTPTIDSLRELLVKWDYFNTNVESGKIVLRENQTNYYRKLEQLFSMVFPGRSFVGAAPRTDDVNAPADFWLTDGTNQYELSGLSAGERAIFPILADFAFLNINHSIIIIDEIELHLHPPLQQGLLRALPRLGNDNQFIITTHSRSIASLFPEYKTIKL